MKRNYYLITDLKTSKDYLFWAYVGNDILGSVIGFAKRQDSDISNLRVYAFETKAQWEKYGCDNFHRIALWLSLK
jgi:hypothetical protein